MDQLTYSATATAKILGVPLKTLITTLRRDRYSPDELMELRLALKKSPPPVGNRKQLFLNFKGGTGKTSLSVSYAWRLAELGYSVLVVDLDSQGHATKCLGFEGEDFEKTLLDVLVKKQAISGVVQKSALPNLDFTGAPCGIDIRKVVDNGIRPVVTTGIAHKQAGVGQIGAGIVRSPMDCFAKALAAFADKV